MEKFRIGDKVVILDNIIKEIDDAMLYKDDRYVDIAIGLIGKTCTISLAMSTSNFAMVDESHEIIIPKCAIMHFKDYRKLKIKSILE